MTTRDTTTTQFTLTAVADAVAAAIPHREFLVHCDRRFTYSQITHRSRRLADFLAAQGLGCHTDRRRLANHEAGQDLVGIYAYNGNEYVETLLGTFRARCAPFNVNFRYTAAELLYLLTDAGATGLVYHAEFAPQVAQIRRDLPRLRVLIQIADDSDNDLLEGAADYESVIAAAPEAAASVWQSPDDLYVLYTGGTTGMPKGVLWRQHDIFMAALGGRDPRSGRPATSYGQIARRAREGPCETRMILPPLMHGAAQWAVLAGMSAGQTLVFPTNTHSLDATDIVSTIERLRVDVLTVVGDAMARPILSAVETGRADVSSVKVLASGGAPLSTHVKNRFIAAIPGVEIVDAVGSSETGAQMYCVARPNAPGTARFTPGPDSGVIAEDFSRLLEPGSDDIGWLAQRRFIPLGYHGDAAKTAQAFRTIDGVRYAIAGDRARWHADGTIEMLGRDSLTVNSGGEKIFVEEVEGALASHPAVADVVVTGRASANWGQEVVAIVALNDATTVDASELLEYAATTLARYKLPKAIVFRTAIKRSPAGKADYRWAREQASASRPGPDTNGNRTPSTPDS